MAVGDEPHVEDWAMIWMALRLRRAQVMIGCHAQRRQR